MNPNFAVEITEKRQVRITDMRVPNEWRTCFILKEDLPELIAQLKAAQETLSYAPWPFPSGDKHATQERKIKEDDQRKHQGGKEGG